MGHIEGDFVGRAVPGSASITKKKGIVVELSMEITEGEHKSRRVDYQGKLDEKYIHYTKRDLIALGWKGQTMRTLAADLDAAKAVVPFRVEVATHTYEDTGKTRTWSAVRSIGGAAKKPGQPLTDDDVRSVDDWFANAQAPEREGGAPPPDDLPF